MFRRPECQNVNSAVPIFAKHLNNVWVSQSKTVFKDFEIKNIQTIRKQ